MDIVYPWPYLNDVLHNFCEICTSVDIPAHNVMGKGPFTNDVS